MILALLKRLHNDQRGQIVPLFMFGVLGLVLLVVFLLNTGAQLDTRMKVQNAADAAAITQAAWTARTMNLISMNNVAITQTAAASVNLTAAYYTIAEATYYSLQETLIALRNVMGALNVCSRATSGTVQPAVDCAYEVVPGELSFKKIYQFEKYLKEPLRKLWQQDMGAKINFKLDEILHNSRRYTGRSLSMGDIVEIKVQLPPKKLKYFHYTAVGLSQMNHHVNDSFKKITAPIQVDMAKLNQLNLPPRFYPGDKFKLANDSTKLPVNDSKPDLSLCLSGMKGRLTKMPQHNKLNVIDNFSDTSEGDLVRISKILKKLQESKEDLEDAIKRQKSFPKPNWSLINAMQREVVKISIQMSAAARDMARYLRNFGHNESHTFNVSPYIAQPVIDDFRDAGLPDPGDLHTAQQFKRTIRTKQYTDASRLVSSGTLSDLSRIDQFNRFLDLSLMDIPGISRFSAIGSSYSSPLYLGENFREMGYKDDTGPLEYGRKTANEALFPLLRTLRDAPFSVSAYGSDNNNSNHFTQLLNTLWAHNCGPKRLPGTAGKGTPAKIKKWISSINSFVTTMNGQGVFKLQVGLGIIKSQNLTIYHVNKSAPPLGTLGKIRDEYSLLASTGFKQENAPVVPSIFTHPAKGIYAYAQAEVYNDTFYDLYTQDWNAKLVPSRLLKNVKKRKDIINATADFPPLNTLLKGALHSEKMPILH